MAIKQVRGLARGLAVLGALSEAKFADPTTLARMTQTPRSTVYRMLETLAAAGYVQRVENADLFQLTAAVRDLARRYDVDVEATAIAGPLLSALNRKLVWPIDFATYDNDTMVVRLSTHAKSPKSMLSHTVVGLRLSMFSSPGLAFLAFLPPAEAKIVIERCKRRAPLQDEVGGAEQGDVASKLSDVRRRGYAFRVGGFLPATSSLAVPVMFRKRPVGCISVMFIRSAGTIPKMAAAHYADILATARAVERGLDEVALATQDRQSKA